MRFHLQALAVTPIFLFVVASFSHELRRDLPPRGNELEYRQYAAPARDLVYRSLGGSPLSVERPLEARSPQVGPYRAPPKTKLSAQEQRDRKAAKKAAVGAATQANKNKHARYQSLTPAQRKTQKLDKPKRPKENMAKGAPQSAKSQAKQAAAKQRITDRKAAGAAKFAPAKAAYAQMTNLPGRRDVFGKKGGEQATGRQVRNAVFNSHHFSPNRPVINAMTNAQARRTPLVAPKPFENRPQGPAGNQAPPLRNMNGRPGTEFPIGQNKGGYQAKTDALGTMRVITQGNQFKGVVAHDPSRAPGSPGYMDHFQARRKRW